ncbi:NusA-like transcription termination signal-binding factor [Candidatus Micrarchaeota archaeon]|nr:NusA-like transcription termination signal-binding factor [Candidatus Micrarchaeota archaeon]
MVELTEKGLGYFSVFESVSRVMPSDFVESENFLIFVVDPLQLGKAIGKNGSNIEKLSRMFKKKIVAVADSDDPEIFLRNFLKNVSVLGVETRQVMNENAMIVTVDEKDRGIAIGRGGERIKALKELMKSKFNATVHIRTRRILG